MTYTMQIKSANAMAQRFALDAAIERRRSAVAFIFGIELAIEQGIDAGMDRAELRDLANGALDAISNLTGELHAALDAENLSHDMLLPLDVSELLALVEKLK